MAVVGIMISTINQFNHIVEPFRTDFGIACSQQGYVDGEGTSKIGSILVAWNVLITA